MRLLNIANNMKDIYLFSRDYEGKQIILKDSNFYPYFYELDKEGTYLSYDGNKLKKILVSDPSQVSKLRSNNSYSSDLAYSRRYLIDKVDKLDKTLIKHMFWDIEIQCEELPTYTNPKSPISCISIYNSMSKDIQTFFLGNYKNDKELLEDFIKYIKIEKPDILLAWNSDLFDWPYVYNRWKYLTKGDLAKEISPINVNRSSFISNDIYYPSGISVLDYLNLFKKVYMREASYTLDYIGEKHTGKGKTYKNVDFTQLSEEVKLRNVGDVQIMVDLENKYNIISYFDEVRRLSKSLWEDLCMNSRIIENLLFEEAKQKGVILPNKPLKTEESEKSTFEGATRECLKTGSVFGIGKFDLTSAYPSMILNFCLDPQNIINKEEICSCGSGKISSGFNCICCGKLRNEDAKAYVNGKYVGQTEINNIIWKQNKEGLLPSLIKKLLGLKNQLKNELKNCIDESEEYKKAKIKYDAIKGIVNSSFGVLGLPSFRIFNNDVAATITFLVRDLLMYSKNEIEKEGYKVIYWDTDSIFVETKENISNKLNNLIQQWGKEKYNKDKIDIEFEYEGYFNRLFLLAPCRYYGYIEGKKEPEIKGVEVKRASSSEYEKEYQKNLLEMILNGKDEKEVKNWIKLEKIRFKVLPLINIAFPVKIANKEYKVKTLALRALENTQRIDKKFKVNKGERFYCIYIDDRSSERDLLAFTENNQDFLKSQRIAWDKMIDRSIENKTQTILEANGWKELKGLFL